MLGDRQQKALVYAKASIANYWILDVNAKQVYVFRELTPEGYQQETIVAANTLLALVSFPDITIPLNQLFLQNAALII